MTDKVTLCRICKRTDVACYNRRTICRDCQSKEACKSILNRFGTYRNYNLQRNYGISTEEYDQMYEQQQGLCLICNRRRTLVVDHNHKTGEVRGLLCSGCNTGIAQFEHDISLFDKAKEYVS